MTRQGPTNVPLAKLLFDRHAWARLERSEDRVQLFAGLIAENAEMPPIEVLAQGDGRYLIADGVHRAFACLESGKSEIAAIVIAPQNAESARDCVFRRGLETAIHAALPLSTAERRRAAIRLAESRPDLSHRAIARMVGASHDSIDRWLRQEGEGDDYATDTEPPLVSVERTARRLVSVLARLDSDRGLADLLVPSRMGRHLADALRSRFGDDALKEARRFQSWTTRAVSTLQAEQEGQS